MRIKGLLIVLFLFASATIASAQTKISGTLQCAKADPAYSIDVGDEAGHAMVMVKVACTWPTPVQMAGSPAKDGYSIAWTEVRGGKTSESGIHIGTMANGDKYSVRFQGTGTTAPDHSGSVNGTWSFTGGTGKLKGLTGKGTYKSTNAADGTGSGAIEGEYATPAP
jgi:hypothetical protein